jgi:FMN phosphatase YigB (HAD superfamily)
VHQPVIDDDIFPANEATSPMIASVPALPTLHPDNVEKLFTALREVVQPEAPGFGRPLTRGEIFRGQLEGHWGAAKIVSFDIFDTAIVRKVQAPRDVYLFLADHAPFRDRGSSTHFATLRQQAENIARRRVHAATGSGEATLTEIHTELATLAGMDASLISAMVNAEQLVELSLCLTHPFMHLLYRRAHATGKTVWFVSDTYHDAAFLRRLLAVGGYNNPADRVVASCEERCSKGSGKLLPKLMASAGLKQADLVHIGDNLQSDCVLPSRAGINGVWHPLAGAPEGMAPAATRERALTAGLAAWGTRTFEPARPFWWRFGFGMAGPLLVGFSWWLHERMRSHGVRRAYFLLRDGDVLKRVYDALTEGLPGAIPSALLESSRRAYMLPALGPGAPSLTTQLFVSENARPVGEFLTRLGIKIDDLGAAFKAAGFSSPHEIVEAEGTSRLSALFANPKITERIVRRSAEERELLMRYLRQEGVVGTGERVGLVDIGWNCTIQKALNHAANMARVPTDVVGYYLGTFQGAAIDSVSPTHGYLCDLGTPAERAHPLFQFRQLVEFICTSPRGSLLNFAADGKRVVPVTAEPDHNELQMEAIRELHEGAMDYAQLVRQEGGTFGINALDADAAAQMLYRVIAQPTAEEAKIIGAMHHGDGMGASASRAFASFREGDFTPDSVLTDYNRAYWKAGMLNQQSAESMMLRTLLWLHDG